VNVCIQYPRTHTKGVPGKNLAPRDSRNIGQHHAYSLLHLSSPYRTSTLSTLTIRKEKLTSAQFSQNVHGGTNKKSSPKIHNKVSILHAD
jgi:hypothetical protein